MFKKIMIYGCLLLFVSGSIMFYVVDARRAAARVQHHKDLEAQKKLEAQKLAQAQAEAEQNRKKAEEAQKAADMNEILLQAPIEFEHLKKNSKLDQIAKNMQFKSKVLISAQVASEEKTSKWKAQLLATGFELTNKRKPSNSAEDPSDAVVPTHEPNVATLPFNRVTTFCSALKNLTSGLAVRFDKSGNVVALASLSRDAKIPLHQIESCKFYPSIKQKLSMYKTIVPSTRKAGTQAQL